MNKLLIICGPTATGKTKLAIELAKKFNGELISADSRQIYRGMDIGTGKDNSELHIKSKKFSVGYYTVSGIPLWMYDLVNPNQDFSVADYYDLVWIVIKHAWQRSKLPIIVGGTGFYINALLNGIQTMGIKPNLKLRQELEKKSISQLQELLIKYDPARLSRMNNSDRNNRRRLVRAIEIQNSDFRIQNQNEKIKNERILMIGLTCQKNILKERIDFRIKGRVKLGIINEIKDLLNNGYSWNLPALSSLGYRQWLNFFQGKESREKAIEKWKTAEYKYAKRQMTWFRKDSRLNWFDIIKKDYQNQVFALVAGFLI